MFPLTTISLITIHIIHYTHHRYYAYNCLDTICTWAPLISITTIPLRTTQNPELYIWLGGHNKNSCSGRQKYKAFEDSHEGVWFCITAVLNNKMMVKKVSKHGYRIPNETAVVIIKATIQHLLINISQVSILYCTLSVSEHSTKFFGSKWSEWELQVPN